MIDASSLLQPTDLCLIESSEDRLEIRTKVGSWWLGSAGVIAMIGWAISGLSGVGYLLAQGRVLSALGSLFMTALGCAFLALFAFAATTERLIVTRETVEFQYRLFTGFVLWRWRATHGELVSAPKCIYHDAGDEGGSHQLELRFGRRVKHFGSESKEDNIRAIEREVRRLRRK